MSRMSRVEKNVKNDFQGEETARLKTWMNMKKFDLFRKPKEGQGS